MESLKCLIPFNFEYFYNQFDNYNLFSTPGVIASINVTPYLIFQNSRYSVEIMTPGDECLPRFYTMHEINCRKCRRVMKIQVWYFKRKVLHYKNTETETSGEEKEIVAVARRQLLVSSESWSRQVKSLLNLTLRSRLQSREEVRLSREGRTCGL